MACDPCRHKPREGSGTISLEFERDTDMRQAEAQVEAAVAGVTNLPIDAETPEVNSPKFFDPIADIGISGPFPEATLRFYAREIRDGLLDAGVDRVTFTGYRDREINIVVDEQKLRQLDLTTAEIAQAISQNTADRPSGSVEGDLQAQIRALAAEIGVNELAQLELKTTSQGDKLLLGDVAQIEDGFNSDQSVGFMGGDQAIRMSVSRSATADTVESFETMNTYLEEVREILPASLKIEVFNAAASLVEDRLALLIKNGVTGLALVLIVLFIFLDFRIAFWGRTGHSHLTFDDFGRNVPHRTNHQYDLHVCTAAHFGHHCGRCHCGGRAHRDAICHGGMTAPMQRLQGAGRMAAPVIAASLTTMAAFGPILLVGDVVGPNSFCASNGGDCGADRLTYRMFFGLAWPLGPCLAEEAQSPRHVSSQL